MIHGTKIICFYLVLAMCSCGGNKTNTSEGSVPGGTPVTAVTVSISSLAETVELNAVSAFLLKTPVKSPATGYAGNIKIKQGDLVQHGQLLMTLQTKESRSIGNTINKLDTSFHFKGILSITADAGGYISQVNFQDGDYVQEGEQVAVVSDAKSFVFILQLPYELTPLLQSNKNVELLLPDSTTLAGVIVKAMPSVEAASQTQSYLISVSSDKMIPENLIAKVRLVKASRQNTVVLPREALLTDETQSIFWVMKLINDTVAVRVPVKKGIESKDKVEILSPVFSGSDRILVSGNYALPDTALVRLKK